MMRGIAGDSIRARGRVAVYSHVKRLSSPLSLRILKTSLLATTAICAVMVLARPAGETAGGAALGNSQFFTQPGSANNSQGLTGDQLADARFYADGTIDQVLTDRAAAAQAAADAAAAQSAAEAAAAAAAQQAAEAAQAAAAQQAAADQQAASAQQAALAQQAQAEQAVSTANAITNDVQNSSVTPPDPAVANAGASAAQTAKSEAVDNELKAVDDKAKADDERRKRERERRRTAQTSRRGHAGSGSGGGLGATIRSIDVNGQRFNLQNGAPNQGAPAQAPQ